MNTYLNDFIMVLNSEEGLSPHTLKNYKSDILQFLKDSPSVITPKDITKYSIRSFMGNIMHLEKSTRRRKLASIRKFCEYLREENLLEHNPALDIKSPKEDKKLPDVASTDEIIRVIESAKNPKDRAILQTLYATGCRISELVNIKLSDINFQLRKIKVHGKGSKDRNVNFGDNTLEAIRSHLETRKVQSEYLFESRYGNTHMDTRSARERVYENAKGLGLHPHTFRHCFATHMHSNGADIMHLKYLLGHESIATTQIYTHIVNNEADEVYTNTHPMS